MKPPHWLKKLSWIPAHCTSCLFSVLFLHFSHVCSVKPCVDPAYNKKSPLKASWMARWQAKAEVYPPALSWGRVARTWFRYLPTHKVPVSGTLSCFVNKAASGRPRALSKAAPRRVTWVPVYSVLSLRWCYFFLALRSPLMRSAVTDVPWSNTGTPCA